MELSAALRLLRHQRLLVPHPIQWADLGCGTGLFTTALAQLLPEGSTIYAVDRSREALAGVPPPPEGIRMEKLLADFMKKDLSLPPLDGILMANSLHFVKDQDVFLARARGWLKTEGSFLVIEYDTDEANRWVPYPVPYDALARRFGALGYRSIEKMAEHPSVFRRAPIYSALVSP